LKKRNQRIATILIVSIALALLVYVTLDVIYFHVFFSAENADVASIIPPLIVVVSLCLVIFVRRTGKPLEPSTVPKEEQSTRNRPNTKFISV